MPQLLEMSHDQYTAIRRFIVRHIQDQDFAQDDGIPGRVLVHLCLERFYPEAQDPEDIKTKKKSIEGAIRRMVGDSMLQLVYKNQKVVFRLDPYFNIKDKMNPSASQPCEDPRSTQEALEALEKETSPDIEDEEMDQQIEKELDQQLAQQLDESMNQMDQTEEEQEGRAEEVMHDQVVQEQEDQTEEDFDNSADTHQEKQAKNADNRLEGLQEAQEAARIEAARHAKAYAEITRGAAPMPRTHIEAEDEEEDEDPIRTPSRKRRKILEIAASDSSSSMDPIIPGKYPNSTPRRRQIQLGTPLSASRRHSVPTGTCNSPFKQRSPRHIEQRFIKEERTDASPAWLKAKVDDLCLDYPGSSIISENGLVKCLDCEGRTFKPAGNQSLHPVITHLRGKGHQVNAARRQEKLGLAECFFPTTIPTMDFNVPQESLMVFANPRQQPQLDIASAAALFAKAFQDDAHQKVTRTTFLESRVQEMQKTNKEQQARLDASLAAFERQKAEQQELMSEMLTSSEKRYKESSQEVIGRVKFIEEKSEEQLQRMEARITVSEEQATAKLDDIGTKLARSDQRNYNDIQDIAERVKESLKDLEERDSQHGEEFKNLKEINEGQNVIIRELESQITEKAEHLEKMVEAQNAKIHVLQSQACESPEKIKEFQQTIKTHNEEIHSFGSQLAECTEKMMAFETTTKAQNEKIHNLESQSEENTRKRKELEKTIEAQDENIHDLESQCQLLRDAREQHEKTVADEVESHFQQTEKQLEEFKKESAEDKETIAEQSKTIQGLVAWIQKFQKAFEEREAVWQKSEKETSAKIRSLETAKKDQNHYQEGLEKFIYAIMEDVVGLREIVQDTIRPTVTDSPVSPVRPMTRVSV